MTRDRGIRLVMFVLIFEAIWTLCIKMSMAWGNGFLEFWYRSFILLQKSKQTSPTDSIPANTPVSSHFKMTSSQLTDFRPIRKRLITSQRNNLEMSTSRRSREPGFLYGMITFDLKMSTEEWPTLTIVWSIGSFMEQYKLVFSFE